MEVLDRDQVFADLESGEEEIRRLAVERLTMLPPAEASVALVERLGDPSWRVRKAAVERLCASASHAEIVDALVAALADGENPGRRNAALEALIRCGSKVVPALLEATRDPDVDVRKQAIDALAGIGDERASEQLIGLLEDRDPNVRGAAADALGAIGSDAAVDALLRVAGGGEEPIVGLSAIRALARMEVPVSVAALVRPLEDPLLRPAAFSLLGISDDPQSLAVLLKGLAEGTRSGREAAMEALVRRVSRPELPHREACVAEIRDTLSGHPSVLRDAIARLAEASLSTRLMLVQFLGLLERRETVVPLLLAGQDEALSDVVLAALGTAGTLSEEAIDAGWDQLEPASRMLACSVLARASGERGEARLLSSLDSEDTPLRIAAAAALGARGSIAALPDLVRRLFVAAELSVETFDEDERDALAAAIVSNVEAGPAEAVDRAALLLEQRLHSAEESFRLAAARILGHIGRPSDQGRIEQLLADESPSVRRAAVDALVRVAPPSSEALRLAMVDEAPLVRSGVASALAAHGRSAEIDDLAALAGDEDARVRAAATRAAGGLASRHPEEPSVRERALEILSAGIERGGLEATAAVEALSAMGGAGVAEIARRALDSPEPDVVEFAVTCIARHGDASDLQGLFPLFSHGSWNVRAQAVQAMADRGVERAVPAILRRLDSEQDDFVRETILSALGRLER